MLEVLGYLLISVIGVFVLFYGVFGLSPNKDKGYGIVRRVLDDVLEAILVFNPYERGDNSLRSWVVLGGAALVFLGVWLVLRLILAP